MLFLLMSVVSQGLFGTERAQVSIELIVLLAAVVAVALLLASQMQKTAEKGAKLFSKKSEDVFKIVDDI